MNALNALRPAHLLILLLVILLLFGARRLPELARGVGQSLRIFKTEIRADGDDGASKAEAEDEPR